MRLQVIQDSKGNNAGVFIPMDKWMLIKSSYPNIEHVDDDMTEQMKLAALELYNDYKNDKELTIFTQLDIEDFYEAR
jgi:hypothetical protein